jgi:glutaredoxin
MPNQNTKTISLFIIVILVFLLLVSYGWKAQKNIFSNRSSSTDTPISGSQKNMDAFAQCLAEKKITMYGAAWCTHCKKEKAAFGTSFAYVPYVECPDNMKLCLEKNIDSYPTWITAQGIAYEGEQGIETLSGITGCILAQEKKVVEVSTTTEETISDIDTQ